MEKIFTRPLRLFVGDKLSLLLLLSIFHFVETLLDRNSRMDTCCKGALIALLIN